MGEFEVRMAALRTRYLARLGEDLAAMESLLAGSPTQEQLTELQERAHKLAGISGTFGFGEVTQVARALDRTWSEEPEDIQHAQSLLARLRECGLAAL